MATITIPAGGVDLVSTTVRPSLEIGGATLTSGQTVYRDSGDDNELKACDVTASASAECIGVLIQDTADGEGAVVAGTGCIIKNPTFTKGNWYVVDNSGSIALYSDLTGGGATDYVTWLGYCDEDGYLAINIIVTGDLKS